jgi:hypothetical protein
MTTTVTTEKSPRISCYQIPIGTWLLCALIIGIATYVRLLGGDKLHQVADAALFILAVVNTMNFLIPFSRPNTILGGARLSTLVLATAALICLIGIH